MNRIVSRCSIIRRTVLSMPTTLGRHVGALGTRSTITQSDAAGGVANDVPNINVDGQPGEGRKRRPGEREREPQSKPSRRIRSSNLGSAGSASYTDSQRSVPSLKEFMRHTKVIRQYRSFLRVVSLVPDDKYQVELKREITDTFRLRSKEVDPNSISMAVTEGERKLQQLRSMVGYQDPFASADQDSWLNIDDKEDPRGRVGIGWPWDRRGFGQ